MKKYRVLLAALLTLSLLMTACGGSAEETTAETETTADTATEETLPAETEEETEAETREDPQKEMTSFTDFIKLSVVEDKCTYDKNLGAFVVQFTDENIRYMADDTCSVGISGNGEASSMAGTIDLTAHPEFENGDYYTGVVIKPTEEVPAGTYKVTITFAMYIAAFTCTIG